MAVTARPGAQARNQPAMSSGWNPGAMLWRPAVAAGLMALLGLTVRLLDLGHESLWIDEAYTLRFSHMPIWRLIEVGGDHEHPPLFYLLTHFALAVDNSYLVPRLLVALAGTGCIVALYALGKRLFGSAVGLIAAALLAVSPLHLWFSADGRPYEVSGLLVLLSYLALLWAIGDSSSPSRWVVYGLAVLAAMYTDYTVFFALLPQLLLALHRPRAVVRAFALTWAAIVAAYVPWIGMLATDASRVASGYWVPAPTWPSFTGIALSFLGLQTTCPEGSECVPAAWPLAGDAHIATVITV